MATCFCIFTLSVMLLSVFPTARDVVFSNVVQHSSPAEVWGILTIEGATMAKAPLGRIEAINC
jgi:hypothetical protein